MSKQYSAGKSKHIPLTVLQKSLIIRKLESDKSQRQVMASYNVWLSTTYDIRNRKTQLWSFVASRKFVKDVLKRQTLKEPMYRSSNKKLPAKT